MSYVISPLTFESICKPYTLGHKYVYKCCCFSVPILYIKKCSEVEEYIKNLEFFIKDELRYGVRYEATAERGRKYLLPCEMSTRRSKDIEHQIRKFKLEGKHSIYIFSAIRRPPLLIYLLCYGNTLFVNKYISTINKYFIKETTMKTA